jgi:hypothetical protein
MNNEHRKKLIDENKAVEGELKASVQELRSTTDDAARRLAALQAETKLRQRRGGK